METPRLPECAAEAAWGIQVLFRATIHCASLGFCVGNLGVCDIVRVGGHLHRAPARFIDRRWRHRVARRTHLREGHDQSCEQLGVPRSALRRLLCSWSNDDAASLLGEAIEEALIEMRVRPFSQQEKMEIIRHAIGRRITACEPANRNLIEGQIPRFASNAPSSKRFFTWVRNLAASAPSTMR